MQTLRLDVEPAQVRVSVPLFQPEVSEPLLADASAGEGGQAMTRKKLPEELKCRPTLEERFWTKVDKSGGPDACWPWTAYRSGGYGRIGVKGHGSDALTASRGFWPTARFLPACTSATPATILVACGPGTCSLEPPPTMRRTCGRRGGADRVRCPVKPTPEPGCKTRTCLRFERRMPMGSRGGQSHGGLACRPETCGTS